jgi:hypothetical protein
MPRHPVPAVPRSLAVMPSLAVMVVLAGAWAAALHGQEVPAPGPTPAIPPAAAASAASLVPEPAAVDLGDVFDGEPARAKVKFTNVSKADWAVAQVKTTCGCTVATVHGPDGAELPPRPVDPKLPMVTLKPGESLAVDVEMLTTNQHGAVEKGLQVFPVDPALPMVSVPVRARVSKAFAVSPDNVNLGNLTKSGRIERSLVIQAQALGSWSIDGFESAIEGRPLPDFLKFEVEDTEGSNRRIKMVSEGPRPVGPMTVKVRVKLGHEKVKAVEFFIYGVIQPDVTFNSGHAQFPESISFDQMDPGTKVTRTLTIRNADPSVPYVLESVDVQAPKPQFFETKLRTLEEGVAYEVDVTADAAVGDAFFRGNLVVHAKHPDLPSRIVQFHGWVRKG